MADTMRVVTGLADGVEEAKTLGADFLVVCKKTLQNQVETLH